MAAPADLIKLVEQFREHPEMYMSDAFSETALRLQFIDPMFELLGWDVYNRQSYAEAYKDVVHEDSLKIGGSTKAPDYSFRIGGVRKFFVEAKKPSVKIKQDIAPAFQLRRYAWSAKLPLSILTDFEEFAVYDCRVRPEKTDSPSTARTLYLTYDQYAERWDEIAAIFSREAVLKGSFDKYAESTKKKRGTAEVDAAFLDDIEQWRALLARNLALRNPQLSQRDLNFAVQKTIDRIIFLRICEDRGMETYGRLQVLPNGPSIYPRLCELFREADQRLRLASRISGGHAVGRLRRGDRKPALHSDSDAEGMGTGRSRVLQTALPGRQPGKLRRLRGLCGARSGSAERDGLPGLDSAAQVFQRGIRHAAPHRVDGRPASGPHRPLRLAASLRCGDDLHLFAVSQQGPQSPLPICAGR